MPSSKSKSLAKSPIGAVSYDVLLYIFIHCLPQDGFKIRQPNTSIAPILLCHICSAWRTVALSAAVLWSHLSYCIPVWDTDMDDDPETCAFLEGETEFIRWWKQNQRSIAPFLRLDIELHDYEYQLPSGGEKIALVMDLGTTAQHLEMDPDTWACVRNLPDIGVYDTFPNLHTLVIYQSGYPIDHCFYHTFPAIRRLAIVEDDGMSLDNITIPAQWSTLTHLSITTHYISLDSWVSLTSAVPCLQWAYFGFEEALEEIQHINPIKRTLPQLSTLFIESGDSNQVLCSISPLFINLHLPALNYLFLSSFLSAWWDRRGITDVTTILQSVPALRNLTLRKCDHLCPSEIEYAIGPLPVPGGVAPIWNHSPHLAHLQLELVVQHTRNVNESEVEKEVERFARDAFFSHRNRWLDLDNSACPIKTLTVASPSYYIGSNADLKMPSVRRCVGKVSNVALHVLLEPSTDFENAWKEWRSGN